MKLETAARKSCPLSGLLQLTSVWMLRVPHAKGLLNMETLPILFFLVSLTFTQILTKCGV